MIWSKFGSLLGFLFLSTALALGQPITKYTPAILVGHAVTQPIASHLPLRLRRRRLRRRPIVVRPGGRGDGDRGSWLPRTLFWGRSQAACVSARMAWAALGGFRPDVVLCDKVSACVPVIGILSAGSARVVFYCQWPDQLMGQEAPRPSGGPTGPRWTSWRGGPSGWRTRSS